jgi:serine/threonine protein kinase
MTSPIQVASSGSRSNSVSPLISPRAAEQAGGLVRKEISGVGSFTSAASSCSSFVNHDAAALLQVGGSVRLEDAYRAFVAARCAKEEIQAMKQRLLRFRPRKFPPQPVSAAASAAASGTATPQDAFSGHNEGGLSVLSSMLFRASSEQMGLYTRSADGSRRTTQTFEIPENSVQLQSLLPPTEPQDNIRDVTPSPAPPSAPPTQVPSGVIRQRSSTVVFDDTADLVDLPSLSNTRRSDPGSVSPARDRRESSASTAVPGSGPFGPSSDSGAYEDAGNQRIQELEATNELLRSAVVTLVEMVEGHIRAHSSGQGASKHGSAASIVQPGSALFHLHPVLSQHALGRSTSPDSALTKHGSNAASFHRPLGRNHSHDNLHGNDSVGSFMFAPVPRQSTEAILGEEQGDGTLSVNQYVLLQKIGSGCQGEVWLGWDEVDNEYRAVKVMQRVANDGAFSIRSRLDRSRRMAAVTREVAVMKKCRHRNVVSLYEVIDDAAANSLYIVMQYVEHGCLLTMRNDGTADCVDPKRLVGYARQLSAGLQYLHNHNVVHRDIKPENILHGKDDIVCLADFGVSAFMSDVRENAIKEVQDNMQSSHNTQASGSFVGQSGESLLPKGTPAFLAPELLESNGDAEYDGKPSDVWALGVTFFVMLYGKLPWPMVSAAEYYQHVVTSDVLYPDNIPLCEEDRDLEHAYSQKFVGVVGAEDDDDDDTADASQRRSLRLNSSSAGAALGPAGVDGPLNTSVHSPPSVNSTLVGNDPSASGSASTGSVSSPPKESLPKPLSLRSDLFGQDSKPFETPPVDAAAFSNNSSLANRSPQREKPFASPSVSPRDACAAAGESDKSAMRRFQANLSAGSPVAAKNRRLNERWRALLTGMLQKEPVQRFTMAQVRAHVKQLTALYSRASIFVDEEDVEEAFTTVVNTAGLRRVASSRAPPHATGNEAASFRRSNGTGGMASPGRRPVGGVASPPRQRGVTTFVGSPMRIRPGAGSPVHPSHNPGSPRRRRTAGPEVHTSNLGSFSGRE